ncbi:MAG: DUF4249 domain-containing protein [Bacteroidales bacterium]|nr:DUF4249 domain-containing protein [Bacteroidales bacterium]
MKKPVRRLVFVFALMGLMSCTEPIDLENKGMAPMLVITGVISDRVKDHDFSFNDNQIVIQKTTSFFARESPAFVTGAKVWVDGIPLIDMKNGAYEFPDEEFCGVPGQTYTLEVHYDMDGSGAVKVYTATTTMPQACQLDSISLRSGIFRPSDEYRAWLWLHYQDDGSVPTYYCAKLRNDNNGYPYSGRILRYSLFSLSDLVLDGASRTTPSGWNIRHEMQYDNQRVYPMFAGDLLMVELESLSKEYYDYLAAARTELTQNNPLFSGPRSNLPSNIKGGALGIFGSYTTSRASLILPAGLPARPDRP